MSCQHENCEKYGLLQPDSAFFMTNNKLIKRLPICKKCISDNLDMGKMSDILTILQLLDYPYLHKTWEKIYEEHPESVLSRYIAEIRKTPDAKNLRFADTEKMESCSGTDEITEVTAEMRKLFGEEFSPKELLAMQRKYDFIKRDYDEITSMHTESLLTFIRYKVKEEQCTAANEVDAAQKWGRLADKASTQAGINPAQLKKADLIGGISTFSELTQIIEENADGVIPVLPQFKYRPDDAIDFILWNFISYEGHLDGREFCEYEDIYKFYDNRKQAYIEKTGDPYNIFKNDPTEGNRERIKDFIKLSVEDYEDQEGEMNG